MKLYSFYYSISLNKVYYERKRKNIIKNKKKNDITCIITFIFIIYLFIYLFIYLLFIIYKKNKKSQK